MLTSPDTDTNGLRALSTPSISTMNEATTEEGVSCQETSSSEVPKTAFRARLAGFAYAANGPCPNSPDSGAAPDAVKISPGVSDKRRKLPHRSTQSSPGSAVSAAHAKKIGARRVVSEGESKAATPSPKKKRTSTKQRSANDVHNPPNNLVDSLRPGLTLVLIGLNPGLETARTGHAYAHSSNSFWKVLHYSGITPRQHIPADTYDLQDLYGIGNTNICARPTRSGDGLTKDELEEGACILEEKIQRIKPEAVGIAGKGIWETLWKARTGEKQPKEEFKYGWQDEQAWLGRMVSHDGNVVWEGARTYVLSSTSGLNAYLSPAEKLAIWKPLGEWFTQKRRDLGTVKEGSTDMGE